MSDPEIVVGRVVRAHGLRGQLVIQPAGDADVLLEVEELILDQGGRRRVLTVRDARVQGKLLLLAFDSFPDRTAAEPLVGATLLIRKDQLPPAGEGEHYVSQLVGRPVSSPAGKPLGKVVDLELAGALTWLVVENETGRHLVPFTEPLVQVEAETIVIDAPAGLLDAAE